MKDSLLKSSLLTLYMTFRKCLNYCRVTIQQKKLKKNFQGVGVNLINPITETDRILILVPHADDELISCHSLIKSNLKSAKLFFCSLTGTNSSLINKIIRNEEFDRYCKAIGIDYFIPESNDLLFEKFAQSIAEYNPTIICLPSFIDWHKEHILMSELLYRFLSNGGNNNIRGTLVYSVSFPMHYKFVNTVCPMSNKEQSKKWKLFKSIYKSQSMIPVYRFKLWEQLYAFYLGGGYATEYFHYFNVTEWIEWYSSRQKILLDNSIINRMDEVLNISERLYNC